VNPEKTVTVAANAKIEVAARGTVTLAAKGEGSAGGKIVVESSGTVTVKPAGTITLAAGTGSGEGGKIEVKDGATLEVQAEASSKGKVTVQANAVLEVASGTTGGTLTVNGGAIEVAADATVEVKGKLEGSVTFTGDGSPDLSEATIDEEAEITAGEGSEVELIVSVPEDIENVADDLADAIEKAKKLGGQGVVTLNAAFYTAANNAGTAIVVDAAEADNETLYTIKGLGKDSEPALTVGILLANDNVTLDGVKINITTSTRGAITEWATSHDAPAKYWAGVSVTRSADGATVLDNADMVSNNVTVKNCNITFTQTANFTSGIYVSARVDDSATGSAYPQNITLTGNDISVNGGSTSAQAIFFRRYNASVEITNNILSSTNTATTNTYNAPASAIYMNIVAGDFSDDDTPNISGNTLSGVFDFDITIPRVALNNAVFASYNFGTANSTWATTTDNNSNFYKKVYNALISQAKSDGYGLIMLYLGSTIASTNFAIEQYETTSGALSAIDHWGPGISDNVYTEGKNVTTSEGGGIRDRITVSDGTPDASSTGSNVFHWTRSLTGSDFTGE
jgi:hypothetical protein